jgi:hypothetical protein
MAFNLEIISVLFFGDSFFITAAHHGLSMDKFGE